jgi:small subunit ribosomal protein S4
VNVPSYQCSAGDVVEIREKSRRRRAHRERAADRRAVGFPDWVQVDEKAMKGTLKSVPDRDEILPDINENLVVELYSK